MAYIPIDLWREILVRIRVEELMRLRCVCSSWRHLIDCQVFRAQHSTRPSSFPAQNLIVYSNRACYILGLKKINPNKLKLSSQKILSTLRDPIRAKVIKIKRKIDGIYGICNGLVLGFDSRRDVLFAWNPFTGWHQNLPVTDLIKENGYDMHYGIGFDEFSRDCKVVLIRHGKASTDVYVCKLRSPSWKLMDMSPLPALRFANTTSHGGVFASGALHWPVEVENDGQRSISVLAIDLETEKYKLMPLPSYSVWEYTVQLFVLGGCLCTSYYKIGGAFQAWVMKEYGSVNSWSRSYSICGRRLSQALIRKPVAYSHCGNQVLIWTNGHLVWYHLQNRTKTHVILEGWPKYPRILEGVGRSYAAIEFVGSFLPMGCDAMELEIPATMQGERKMSSKN